MRTFLTGFFLVCYILNFAGTTERSPVKHLRGDSTPLINNANYVLHVKKATGPIKLDGIFDEPDWKTAEKATDFHRVLPVDTGLAKSPSEVMMTYDDKAFYIAVIFYDTVPGKRPVESFRRDFVFGNNDNFLVFFDTFLDQTNGFSFGVSACGAEWDGTQSNGGTVNLNWDCKWQEKTVQYKDRWVSEMRIPFRSVRFRSGTDRWYVNFSRLDLKTNEKSAWAPVPRQFATASLAYAGVLQWDRPLPKSPMMFSVIPYVFGGVSRDFEAGTPTHYRKDFGFDAKLGLTTSMNLDLTYNPDFSQAEVDQQVTNLDRFELFYPEKRQFFLENSDLFSNYGFSNITPFFSRRIGLDAPVLAGARLSGKLGENWRLGLLDMQTERTFDQLSRNFLVASLQRRMFSRSNIGFIFVNKEYTDEPGAAQFNRVAGMDYNLASRNNLWSGKLFYHRSFSPENPGKEFAQGAALAYDTRRVHLSLDEASVGENYRAETGYVPRTGYNFLNPKFRFLWIPNRKVVSHGPVLDASYYFDPAWSQQIDHSVSLSYKAEFSSRVIVDAGFREVYTRLREDFDPTHISQVVLKKGTEYSDRMVFADFFSDTRTLFNYTASMGSGGFYGGTMSYLSGQLIWRYQPYVRMMLNFSYNDINLQGGFERARFLLLGPKLDLTLSQKVFFSSFVQYNEQAKNMNINLRFQWRYQPVSDLFVVYTDNYYTGNWSPRNRALVVKLSYWFN